ncbi:MAG: STM3941 family protein [Bacteroidota bacterium]
MRALKLYKSKRKAVRLLLLCTPFVAMGIWMLVEGNLFGWALIAFFGLAYPVGIFNLFDKRPQIILNEIGIFDRSISQDYINWELIQNAYPIAISGQRFICLVVDEKFKPSKKKGRFSKSVAKLNEAIGAQELNINLGQVQKINDIKLTLFILQMSKANKTDKAELLKSLPSKVYQP